MLLIALGIGLGILDVSVIALGIGCYSRCFRCASRVLHLFNSILYRMETKKRNKLREEEGDREGDQEEEAFIAVVVPVTIAIVIVVPVAVAIGKWFSLVIVLF